MTTEKSFKRRVRDRMSKTGESYAAARSQVARKRDRIRAAESRLAGADDRPDDAKVLAATGRRWEEWFTILDGWGARQRTHRDIAAHLVDEHGVPGWWSQSITVWYERSRGMRLKHQQRDGFTINASKTVSVPVEALFEAFVDDRARRRWLTDGTMTLRTSRPTRTARFDWGDGRSRVLAAFESKGAAKSTVAVAHERLADPDEAETAKAAWRARLVELKSALEG